MSDAKRKGRAVDTALRNMAKGNRLQLTATFLREWSESCKKFGGSLTPIRIAKAFAKAKVKIITICSSAVHYYKSAGWGLPRFA